jgi:hypothetical protein
LDEVATTIPTERRNRFISGVYARSTDFCRTMSD